MSDKGSKAERYARAAFQALIERWQAAFAAVLEDLGKNQELYSLLMDGSRPLDERFQGLETVLPPDSPPELVNLLKLLVQEGDLNLLPDLSTALTEVAAGQRQPLRADVTSAVELREEEREALCQALIKRFDRELVFRFFVDPSLMGGLRVRVGDRLIDMSVASRLAALRESVASVLR
jgi:F-type H+-transporting ATPase subunit delta